MKSAFGSKRRARKIETGDDDEGGSNDPGYSSVKTSTLDAPISSNLRKPFKKSSLRQSIAFEEDSNNAAAAATEGGHKASANVSYLGRSSSTSKKKKLSSSRLSFGPDEIVSGDTAEALEDDETFTPKKPALGRRVIEGNTLRKSIPYPVRGANDEEERPTYNRDYLNELKSSTPATPKDLQSLHATEENQGLDASELDGATVVDIDGKFGTSTSAAFIPSEAEIREKKERRARLAHENDFISFDDVGEGGSQFSQLSLLSRKKKEESRLVREDEDLGEGFDEFVDDGRIALGKKQEREAKRRHRKEMAAMIHQAEGSSDEESDDSEAERRAAYEAAQTRAGMDGLHKPNDDMDSVTSQVPSKITPLPVLSECLQRLQRTLSTMELELAKRRKQLENFGKEKAEILSRETEVQELLKQAGSRYAALKADSNGAVADAKLLVEGNNGIAHHPIMDRGLESFGNTPVPRPNIEDVG